MHVSSDPPTRLCVRVGASPSSLEMAPVNDDFHPIEFDSPHFTGRICVRIVHYRGITPKGQEPLDSTPYFEGRKRYFSVQIEGRFKQPWNGDDVIFGVVFERKLRLPPGADLALTIAKWIDPALTADLHADSPWAMSPILCAMNILSVHPAPCLLARDSFLKTTRIDHRGHQKTRSGLWRLSWPIAGNVDDKISNTLALPAAAEPSNAPNPAPQRKHGPLKLPPWAFGNERSLEEDNALVTEKGKPVSAENRKKHFVKASHRKEFTFSPDHVYGWDFYNRYMDIGNLQVRLPGFSVNLADYWDGQPLRYVARSRDGKVTFFVVQFELMDDAAVANS
ncbi:uncharacterized protein SPPG_05667 [Spizellomyces punctatus DAOM BR117]|uniref:Domain of unknown function at the cortex 1 domain-containing protein n=1 Tax=Spizellomyces punctatus (strain DAOM BR117) TaxID=645134 RepID=A0A0L0HEH1_SPIPD|nr:uncharacterized protein SPPG_05667 [Spizellomyces punctatus DAOM BR117]KNC99426.1 hypothetical protein SPPG_05667 [Spizellomyces punctatus DAOM BR117]|eukprot:XP_016607466.1 hypothetical protein SPPG_05667 [Spizellomyces punctatus DAOM BR117]